MGLLNLFKKKKKPAVASCSICKAHMEEGEGYALTTSEVISSKPYWDHKMMEPETLSYTHAHFKSKDETATKMRGIIFEKTAEKDQTWITCESCIRHFDVDESTAKTYAREWWHSKGAVEIPNSGKASENLEPDIYEDVKQYATMEAGAQSMKYA